MEEYIRIGRMDINKLGKYKKILATNEVILTSERIKHIKEKHKEQFYELEKHIKNVIENPDYILQEMQHTDTIIILKEIIKDEIRIKMIIKLATSKKQNKSNSIITFWKIRQRDYRKTIERGKVIYHKI